jgi:predicted nucleotidyltransferase
MGMTKTSLGEVLFTKTQRRVLGLLFGNPDRSFYANEIVRFAGAGIGAVQRELERLAAVRLVMVSKHGNQKHYQANREAPIFEELRGIVLKTFGVADQLRSALAPFSNRIDVAFVYGSVASGTDTANSDIDVLIVGDVSFEEVVTAMHLAQEELRREVNPTVFGTAEFRKRAGEKGSFVARVLNEPKLFIQGADHDLRKLVAHRKAKAA